MTNFPHFLRHILQATLAFLVPVVLTSVAWLNPAQAQAAPQWRDQDGVVVVVGAPFIELYVQPGRGFARFHAVEKNERIRLFKNRNDWYKVETEDGKIGWVPRRALQQIYDIEGYPLDFSTPPWSERKHPWQLGLMVGEMDGAVSYSIHGGYHFTANISGEIKYTQSFGESFNVRLGSFMLLHQPFPQWRTSPFFTLGAGTMKIYPDAVLLNAEDQQDTAMTVGGGVLFYITHKVIARLEYNQHTLLTTREYNEEVEEWKAGFSVLF